MCMPKNDRHLGRIVSVTHEISSGRGESASPDAVLVIHATLNWTTAMPPPSLTILRSYAQRPDPSTLPASILLTHSEHTLTIFDAYPKSIFHFLVLPRVIPPLTASNLANLRTVLKGDKTRAKEVIGWLAEDGAKARSMIEDEMLKRYHFKWDVWMGFHAVPSMEYVSPIILPHALIIPQPDTYICMSCQQTSAHPP